MFSAANSISGQCGHGPESAVTSQNIHDKFHDFTTPPYSETLLAALHALEDLNNRTDERGTETIPNAYRTRALLACARRVLKY